MKHYSLAVLALLVSGFAHAHHLNITATGDKNEVRVDFKTVAIHSSMCGMEVRELNVDLGRPSFTSREEVVLDGRLDIKAQTNPKRPCLTAFGPHRGSITFARGRALPGLPVGSYELTVNGDNAGKLVVTSEGARLE